jgi:hypothetical protein
MRKLTMLTLVTVTLLAAVGCNRGWPRWLCRGDDCNTCGEGSMSPSLMPPTGYGPTYMPSYSSPTTELPGPVTIPSQG